jgi:serine/threonine protein kinase
MTIIKFQFKQGILTNGVVVAVKKLLNCHTIDQKMFLSEVDSMTKVGHPNIVRFIGYCSETKEKALQMHGKTVMAEERERLLCFEYIRKGSLDNYLTGIRYENGRNFSRTVPFHFLYFPVCFRICEIPFSYLRK